MQIDGHAAEWPQTPALEEEGLSFQAMNDASNLYLLIRGTGGDGRTALTGRFRQNVTLWFVKPDGITRAWGLNLNFSHAHSPEEFPGAAHGDAGETPVSLSSMGVVPELVIPQGLQLSTATLPSEIQLQADLPHKNDRQPLCEIGIPLKMIEHQGTSIYADFVTSQVTSDAIRQSQSGQSGSGEGGGGGHHHHGGGSQGGGSRSIEPPNPLDLHLEIALAEKPKP